MNKHSAGTDPMKPECAACGNQSEGALIDCSTCGVAWCKGECFSLHTGPKPAEAEASR